MSGNGAYPEEMDFSHPEIAIFARSLQATLVREPDPTASEDIVRRLAQEARASAVTASEQARRRPAPSGRAGRSWSRRRLAAVALAVAVLPLLMAGLAVAGVRLPAVAENAFEAVGVDLPNQGRSGSSDDPADADQGTGNDGEPAASPAAEPGSEKAVKGDRRQGNGPPSHSNVGGQGQGQNPGQGNPDSGGKAKGKPAAPPGQTKPKPDHGGGNAGGNSKAIGKTDSTPPGQAKKPAGDGDSASAGGQGKGQAKQKG